MIDEKALNEKLAKWAGFKYQYKPISYGGPPAKRNGWYNDTEFLEELPGFTRSLDACFKWLVPKLDKAVALYWFHGPEGWTAKIGAIIQARDDSPALALCLAIEKLIPPSG